jgi:hypothetical protein
MRREQQGGRAEVEGWEGGSGIPASYQTMRPLVPSPPTSGCKSLPGMVEVQNELVENGQRLTEPSSEKEEACLPVADSTILA